MGLQRKSLPRNPNSDVGVLGIILNGTPTWLTIDGAAKSGCPTLLRSGFLPLKTKRSFRLHTVFKVEIN